MKDMGLVGARSSGKSTLFTALTRTGAAGGRANQAVVEVQDPRLEVLARLQGSPKSVPAQLRFIDVPGGLAAQGLAALRATDALALVLRAFGPGARPVEELVDVTAELILADLSQVEGALESASRRMKGRGQGVEAAELTMLERAREALSEEVLLRDAIAGDEDRKALRGLSPLTLKPWIVVANLEEGLGLPEGLPDATVGVWAEIEAETAAMPAQEARALLEEFGVAEPGLETVVAVCYRALDLVTFLTFNETEARAWEVRRGATAQEAAGVIHSDLQRGFIRAEVVAFDDLVTAGGWEAARARGSLRVEGKGYVVREGDVLHVRFAV
jgi:ribosome-binding ATPase YchF (GTP1/OBG family)